MPSLSWIPAPRSNRGRPLNHVDPTCSGPPLALNPWAWIELRAASWPLCDRTRSMPPIVRAPAPQSYQVRALDRRRRTNSLQEMPCADITAHRAGTSGCCRTPGEVSPSPYRSENTSTFIIFNKCGENKRCIWGWNSMVLTVWTNNISERLSQLASCTLWVTCRP